MTKKEITILFFILLVGFLLRVNGISSELIWQDEAETVIQGSQILAEGYPHGMYKGEPIFENESQIEKKDDPVYAYESSNFYPNNIERRKGWLTYYLIAPFIKMFGINAIVLRLVFVFISLGAIYLVFLLASSIYQKRSVGLIASALYAINYPAYIFEGEIRYYSLMIFLLLAGLYFLYKYCKKGEQKDFYWFIAFLILEFHVHIVVSITMFFFAVYQLIKKEKIDFYKNRKLAIPLAVYILQGLIWLVVVRFWNSFGGNGDPLYLTILFPLVVLVPVYYFYRLIKKSKLSSFNFRKERFLVCYLVICLIAFFLFWPSTIIRMHYSIIAILIIILAGSIIGLKQKKGALIKFLLILVILSYPIVLIKVQGKLLRGSSNWIMSVTEFIESRPGMKNIPIFTSYQDLAFRLYADYDVKLIWPIKKSYFDDPENSFFIIINTEQLWYNNEWFYGNPYQPGTNYVERLGKCKKNILAKKYM